MKLDNQITNLEQSMKLLTAGVNPKTASRCFIPARLDENGEVELDLEDVQENKTFTCLKNCIPIPCWTTADLIDLLPKYIEKDKNSYRTSNAMLRMDKEMITYVAYVEEDEDMTVRDYSGTVDTTLIENLVNAVVDTRDICNKSETK